MGGAYSYGAVTAPAAGAFAITPTNGAELYAVALYVAGTGDVTVVTEQGDTVTFTDVPAGSILPIRVRQVRATGTDATGIVGLR